MLFYGKEIDIFYIILLVILILVIYILISYYMQQKQSIAITTSSQPIIDTTNVAFSVEKNKMLTRGAFAISLWLNISSWVLPTNDATFNILTMNNSNPIFRLYIDKTCNLCIDSTFFKNDLNKTDVYRITGNDGNNVNVAAGNNVFQVSGTNFNNGKPLTYTIPSGSYNAVTLANMLNKIMNAAGKWTETNISPNFYTEITPQNLYSIRYKTSNPSGTDLIMTFSGVLENSVSFDSKLIFGQNAFNRGLSTTPMISSFAPTFSANTSVLPINEPMNIILNYNGDDDYDEDQNQFFTAKDGTKIPIYNTNTGFANSNRALDVFINGRLNNTIILNTSLTRNDKSTSTTTKCNGTDMLCVSYNDQSMNYLTIENITLLIGSVGSVSPVTSGPVGTISNVTFILGGCTVEKAQSINNSGNSSNFLDDLFSYKLQFSFLENNKKIKVFEFL